jgi:O-antigen/teichoic acid export membrane protein
MANVALVPILVGANNSMYKFLPDADRDRANALESAALVGSGLLALVFLVAYGALRGQADGIFRISLEVWDLAAIGTVLFGGTILTESLLRGQRKYTLIARLRFGSALLFFIGFLVLFRLRGRMEVGLYFSALFASHLFFSALALARGGPGALRFSGAEAREVFGYGFLNMANALLLICFTVSDLFVVNYLLPGRDLGVYNVYQGFVRGQFSVLFFEVFCVVFLPTIASMDKDMVHRRFVRLLPLLLPVVALGAAALIVLGVWLVGRDYPMNAEYVLLAAAGICSATIFQMYNAILSMEGKRGAGLCLIPLAAALPISCALQFQFARWMGIRGAMLAVIAGNLVLVAFFEVTTRLGKRWLSHGARAA